MRLEFMPIRAARPARIVALALAGALAAGCNRTSASANAEPANAAPPVVAATAVATTVPFVGCAQDGQGGRSRRRAASPGRW